MARMLVEMKLTVADALDEKGLMHQVKDAAALFRWNRYHTFRSQWSPAGFPDEVLVRGNRIIFAELKTNKTQLRPEQRQWMWDLAKTGLVEVYLWRPSSLDRIIEVLR